MDNASRDRAQLTRTELANGATAKYTHMDLDLRQVLNASEPYDVALKSGDELLIPASLELALAMACRVAGSGDETRTISNSRGRASCLGPGGVRRIPSGRVSAKRRSS